jgi:hypothetical protein
VESGGVVCPSCGDVGGGGRVGPRALEQLRGFVRGDLRSPIPGLKGHLGLLETFASYHLGGRGDFRSFSILRSLWTEVGVDFP